MANTTTQECPRCQGFMIASYLEGFEGNWAIDRYIAFRCVNCGAQREAQRLFPSTYAGDAHHLRPLRSSEIALKPHSKSGRKRSQ